MRDLGKGPLVIALTDQEAFFSERTLTSTIVTVVA
jgi:hypothetical protein